MKRTRKTTDERREEIARAALRILGRGGRKLLTTQTLAEEIGVTTGALFRHFVSLEEVLAEAALITIEDVEATFPLSSAPPLIRLLALARKRADLLGANAGMAWMLRSELAPEELPPEQVRHLRAIVGRSRNYVLKALREGQAAKVIRADIAPEQLLVIVMGTIHTLIGAPGVHDRAGAPRAPSIEKTMDALRVLLSPAKEKES